MTTAAKLLREPGDGHGLVDSVTNPIYNALVNGKPTGDIVAIVILKPSGWGGSQTAKARHQHVNFEVSRLEPVYDSNQANELRWLLQGLYEQRTSTGEQRTLPLGLGSDAEKCAAVMERLEDWAEETGKTGADLEQMWRENFGIGPDKDWSYGDSGVPGDYRKASLAHLLSFGYEVGAIKTDTPLPSDEREAAGDGEDEKRELPDGFEAQFGNVVTNIKRVLDEAGGSFRDLVKVNVLLTRASDVATMNKLYADAFGPAPYPARTTCVVVALPNPAMLIEIEAVAAVKG